MYRKKVCTMAGCGSSKPKKKPKKKGKGGKKPKK